MINLLASPGESKVAQALKLFCHYASVPRHAVHWGAPQMAGTCLATCLSCGASATSLGVTEAWVSLVGSEPAWRHRLWVAVGLALPSCGEHPGRAAGGSAHCLHANTHGCSSHGPQSFQDLVYSNLAELCIPRMLPGHFSATVCKAFFYFLFLGWKQLSFSTEDFSGEERKKMYNPY